MKKIFAAVWISLFLFTTGSITWAGEFGTAAEAEALVKKAIAHIKANPKEKALADLSDPKGKFVDRDLYIFVYDIKGVCVAHGFNQKMVGKDLSAMKDMDGKAYVKERIEIAQTKGKGWQDYKFTNPMSKKIEGKSAYVEKLDDLIIGCGVYKK